MVQWNVSYLNLRNVGLLNLLIDVIKGISNLCTALSNISISLLISIGGWGGGVKQMLRPQ